MSRIGKKFIEIPSGVTIVQENDILSVKGPKGANSFPLHPLVSIGQAGGNLTVMVGHPEIKQERALWGLYRALIANVIKGVSVLFEKKMEMVGVGYKAAVAGKKLILEVGFSHPVEIAIPEEINCTVEKNVITLSGVDKQAVGQIAAEIRAVRRPEPYKGKGIKYVGEVIRRKAGKAAKAAGAK